jgi:hypothetical protein
VTNLLEFSSNRIFTENFNEKTQETELLACDRDDGVVERRIVSRHLPGNRLQFKR